ncbi:hypothetical protein PIB30_068079 [Stylosanthes scabra]|uniref:Uncharacterized protein n=1 Tax=Stylosanthes scabra TaxID=79078 RepID=A0ABU6QNW9_9FABA|nr:hypothetical protein [Stylosanthes scabra]
MGENELENILKMQEEIRSLENFQTPQKTETSRTRIYRWAIECTETNQYSFLFKFKTGKHYEAMRDHFMSLASEVEIDLVQGHDFRCVPKSVAVIFQNYLKNDPQKRALVDELGFSVFSSLPNYYLKQKVLKQIYNRFDTYDNIIHAVAGEVEITTEKIGKALGLNHTGSTYDEKIIPKELSGEDYDAYKFFQGKTQAALSSLIFNTKVDTEETRSCSRELFCSTSKNASSFPPRLQTSHQEHSLPCSISRTQETKTGPSMCITSSSRR